MCHVASTVVSPQSRSGSSIAEPQARPWFNLCERGSREEFLMERYTAFPGPRMFRVWQEPWQHTAVEVEVTHDSLPGYEG